MAPGWSCRSETIRPRQFEAIRFRVRHAACVGFFLFAGDDWHWPVGSEAGEPTADYAIAGRHLPLIMIVTTTFATWFGSETVLGIGAKFVQGNLGTVVELTRLAPLFCLIFVGLFFAARLYKQTLLTISDYYRQRFGKSVEIPLLDHHHAGVTSVGWRRR